MMTAVLASASMAFSRETSALLGNALATHAALDNLRNQMDAKLAQMSEKMDAKLMELRREVQARDAELTELRREVRARDAELTELRRESMVAKPQSVPCDAGADEAGGRGRRLQAVVRNSSTAHHEWPSNAVLYQFNDPATCFGAEGGDFSMIIPGQTDDQ